MVILEKVFGLMFHNVTQFKYSKSFFFASASLGEREGL
jgi:hypothetical protein